MALDIFVVENPPRYDPSSSDPTALKQKLNKYANSLLSTTLGFTERVFIVEQASIARSSIKARNELYQGDGVHLTNKGLYYYSSNLITGLQDCYEDTKHLETSAVSSDKRATGNNPNLGQGRGGRGHSHHGDYALDQGRGWRQQGRGGRYRDIPDSDYMGRRRGFNRQNSYQHPPPHPTRHRGRFRQGWYGEDYPDHGYNSGGRY